MNYETTPVNKNTKQDTTKMTKHDKQRKSLKLDRKIADMNTPRIILYLTNRHKLFLSLTVNILLVTYTILNKF